MAKLTLTRERMEAERDEAAERGEPGAVRVWQRLLAELQAAEEAERRRVQQAIRQDREEALAIARLDRPLPYIKGSDTSKAAAEDAGKHASNDRVRVLVLLLMRPYGMIWNEIADTLGMRGSTCRARIADCRDRGLIFDSGRRRDTDSGSSATVWVAWRHVEQEVVQDELPLTAAEANGDR